ncbi:MAG: ankyrin repeat domain-containing protein [Gammaproteobacteria bacterium]
MIGRVKAIAEKIKIKLQDDLYLDKLFKHAPYRPCIDEIIKDIDRSVTKAEESKYENINDLTQVLVITASEFDMLAEIHELLELNIFSNIDSPIQFKEKNPSNGKTLLGISAFHGHIDLVKYLVEVRLTDINAKDFHGNTALHQVTQGDSFPFHNSNFGTFHKEVAEYLIQYGADLPQRNQENQTAFDKTKWCAPLSLERAVGRRFITNTGSAIYYADKVRPVFETELKKQFTLTTNRKMKAEDYKQFCLQHASEEYVKNGILVYGFSTLDQLCKVLNNLSAEEWKQMRMIIESQKPEPYSFKYGPISDQIPKIIKQSVAIGILTALLFYYETQSIIISAGAGLISATLAWSFLSERATQQDLQVRNNQLQRASTLLSHDRFFKSYEQIASQERGNQVARLCAGLNLDLEDQGNHLLTTKRA